MKKILFLMSLLTGQLYAQQGVLVAKLMEAKILCSLEEMNLKNAELAQRNHPSQENLALLEESQSFADRCSFLASSIDDGADSCEVVLSGLKKSGMVCSKESYLKDMSLVLVNKDPSPANIGKLLTLANQKVRCLNKADSKCKK